MAHVTPTAGSDPVLSLSGVTTGNGTALDNGACRSNHTLVTVPSGNVTGGAVDLEGSLDNSNWFSISSVVGGDLAAVKAAFAPDKPVQYVRASVRSGSPITGGGTISAWVASAG